MGKKGKSQQRRQNYFNLQFQQLGEGWTAKITTLDVRKSALRLFKDIAAGNIDFDKDVQYFNEPSFTHNLRLAADDNAYYNGTIFNALSASGAQDPYTTQLKEEHYKRYCAFTIISQSLNTILNGISYNQGIQTAEILQNLIDQIQPYRYLFNGYYITLPRQDDGRLKVERRQKQNDNRTNTRSIGPVKGFPNPSGM